MGRSDCHSGVCNTRALQLAGITRDTADPPGARFGRYDDGEPNGVLTEHGANKRVLDIKALEDRDAHVQRLAATADHYNALGIVAVTDLMAGVSHFDYLDIFRAAEGRGLRQQAILYYDWLHVGDRFEDLPADAREGNVKVGGVKLFMDGSISNRTAWLTEPYANSDDHGILTLDDEALREASEYARRNGIQVAVHAMGDRAIQRVLDVFAGQEPWMGDIPSVRIEHATLMSPDHIAQINAARMTFAVVSQVIFAFAEHDSYAANLTPAQLRRTYPLRSLYDGLERLALSSDAPATTWAVPDNVFVSVRAAVERRAYNGADINAEHALTVPQALLLYTGRARRVAAFSGVGTIEPGNDASFVVLDRDVFTVPVEEIDQVRVAQTHLRGEQVFSLG